MTYRGHSDHNYYFTGWRQGEGDDLEYRERQFFRQTSEGSRGRTGYSRHHAEAQMTQRRGQARDWKQDWNTYMDDGDYPGNHTRSAGPSVTQHRHEVYDDMDDGLYNRHPTYSTHSRARTRFSEPATRHEYQPYDDEDPEEYFTQRSYGQGAYRTTGREWNKDWDVYRRTKQNRPVSEVSSERSGGTVGSGNPRRVNVVIKEEPEDFEYYLDGKRVEIQRGPTPGRRVEKDDDVESDTKSVIVDGQANKDQGRDYKERVFVLVRHRSGCLGQGVCDGIKRAIYEHFPKRVVFGESRGIAGSFEVYLNGKLLFSRLQTGGYPYENDVVKAIDSVRHGRNFSQIRHGASGICTIL